MSCASQLHSLPANYSDLLVTGDDEGIFGIDAQYLYALKPLDREKQPSYSLQVFIIIIVIFITQVFTVTLLFSSLSCEVRALSVPENEFMKKIAECARISRLLVHTTGFLQNVGAASELYCRGVCHRQERQRAQFY